MVGGWESRSQYETYYPTFYYLRFYTPFLNVKICQGLYILIKPRLSYSKAKSWTVDMILILFAQESVEV